LLADGRVGFQAGNDLDHLHERHGIEEVVARKLRWVAAMPLQWQ